MKLSISNLAWENKDIVKIVNMMKKYNFRGMEILPTKIWGSWEKINDKKIISFQKFLNRHNIEVSSIQSLFFKTNLYLEKQSDQLKILRHLKKLIMISRMLNCKNLVFGSPAFRVIKNSTKTLIEKKLLRLFRIIHKDLVKNNIIISIEPNPKFYGCNFINTLSEANKIIKKAKLKNIKIQLDTACVLLENGTLNDMKKYFNEVNHIHLSEKNLTKINQNNNTIKRLIKFLKKKKWKNWISLEMKNVNFREIETSMKFINSEFR
jgi:D-psicose/D-tagatose/L-ribulose 3-epimerase